MITVQIHESTKPAMLRAIRAACNELLGETTADLTTLAAQHNSRAVQLHAAAEAETDKAATALSAHNQTAPTIAEMIQAERLPSPTVTIVDEAHLEIPAPTAEELDSAGHAWNAELHASTKSKNADGTWKKRRGTGGAVSGQPGAEKEGEEVTVSSSAPMTVAPPPLPPSAPAEPVMPKIFALITSQICTINDAVAAAQAEGFADLGANGLGGAPVEKQLAVLRKLEG